MSPQKARTLKSFALLVVMLLIVIPTMRIAGQWKSVGEISNWDPPYPQEPG